MPTRFPAVLKTCAFAATAALGILAAVPADAATARREPNGAIRFYDERGNDRGYAWCLVRGGRWFAGWSDCSYFTIDQCRAADTGLPGGWCQPNPYASQVPPPPVRRKKR